MTEILKYRGIEEIISQKGLEEKLKRGKKLRIKLGADPNRPDIHLGHAVVLRLLKRFQEAGHTVIFLIGDYTAKIGDPSGRNRTRPILSDEEIKVNAKTYLDQVGKIIDVKKAEIRFNSQWLKELSFADVLKLASSFTVAQTIERDDFQKRLKNQQEIGLHELLYPVMQAYDSVILKADLELGGTDQRFNLLAGRELQKKVGETPQDIITCALLVGLDGKEKMSKSLDNYIAVNDSPAEMFGKVMSIPDSLIINYFKLCTDLTDGEIAKFGKQLEAGLNPRDIKFKLAREITTLYHNQEKAEQASKAFNQIHQKKQLPDQIEEVKLAGEFEITKLITQLKLASSNGEARRLVEQGGVKIDGAVINEITAQVKTHPGMVIQVGKRRFLKIK